MPARHAVKDTLLALLDEAFDHQSWHGPTLRGALRGVGRDLADWRPGRGRHSIRELTVHAAYWKYAVRRRLTGAKWGSFPLEGSNWFATAGDRDRTWPDDVRLLVDEHRQLRDALEAFPAARLQKPIDGKRQRAAFVIRGIAAHDLYHAGQIQLIKRLARPSR